MWKDSYLIGVDQIDQQHKQLVLTLQDLLDCLHCEDDDEARTRCKQTMAFMKSYAVVHFSAEEMYQETIGYPDRAAHKKLHDDFAVQLREYEFELMRENYSREATRRLSEILTRWWIWHIVKEDHKMIEYVPKEGP